MKSMIVYFTFRAASVLTFSTDRMSDESKVSDIGEVLA